jgi:hypothetical protein
MGFIDSSDPSVISSFAAGVLSEHDTGQQPVNALNFNCMVGIADEISG